MSCPLSFHRMTVCVFYSRFIFGGFLVNNFLLIKCTLFQIMLLVYLFFHFQQGAVYLDDCLFLITSIVFILRQNASFWCLILFSVGSDAVYVSSKQRSWRHRHFSPSFIGDITVIGSIQFLHLSRNLLISSY